MYFEINSFIIFGDMMFLVYNKDDPLSVEITVEEIREFLRKPWKNCFSWELVSVEKSFFFYENWFYLVNRILACGYGGKETKDLEDLSDALLLLLENPPPCISYQYPFSIHNDEIMGNTKMFCFIQKLVMVIAEINREKGEEN